MNTQSFPYQQYSSKELALSSFSWRPGKLRKIACSQQLLQPSSHPA
jgi:hypothetical protein